MRHSVLILSGGSGAASIGWSNNVDSTCSFSCTPADSDTNVMQPTSLISAMTQDIAHDIEATNEFVPLTNMFAVSLTVNGGQRSTTKISSNDRQISLRISRVRLHSGSQETHYTPYVIGVSECFNLEMPSVELPDSDRRHYRREDSLPPLLGDDGQTFHCH